MPLYCQPHTPGAPWHSEIHGVVIPTSEARGALYDDLGCRWAQFAERNGIPTGVPVPSRVVDLLNEAYPLRVGNPDERAIEHARMQELLNEARSVLADAAAGFDLAEAA